MRPSHVESELLAYLDGELSAADRARVEDHLAGCEGCRAELEHLQDLRHDLDVTFDEALTPIRLSRDAEERIRKVLRQRLERPRRGWWVLRRRWGLFVQAALALLVILTSLGTYQTLALPPAPPATETLVLGQERLAPGSRAALRVIVRSAEAEPTPVAGAEVAVRIPGLASPLFKGMTDASGTADVNFTVPELEGRTNLIVETSSAAGEEQIAYAIDIVRSYKILLAPDKPAYRPGQVIHTRALVLDTLDLAPVVGKDLTLTVLDAERQQLVRESLTTSDFGVAALDIPLPEDAPDGTYTLRAGLGDTTSERSVTVGDYELPPFRLTLRTDRNFYAPGDRVTGVLHAAYFFGQPVADAEVILRGYTGGEERVQAAEVAGKTDETGRFEFALDLPPDYDLQETVLFDLEAAVTDEAGQRAEIREIVPVAPEPIVIHVVPESGQLKPGVENTLIIMTSYPDGTPVKTTLRLRIDGRREASLATNAYGLAAYPFTPGTGVTRIAITASDAYGAEGEMNFELKAEEAPQVLLLHTDRATYKVGDTLRAEALLGEAPPGEIVYLDVLRQNQTVVVLSERVENGSATFALDLDATLVGSLEIHAYTLLASDVLVEDTRWVAVDTPRGVDVTIEADRETYRPGETAQLEIHTALTPTGKTVTTALGIGVVDESVYALETLPPSFARLYFLLEGDLFERAVPNLPDLLEETRDLATKAAWASAPASQFTLKTRAETPPVENTTEALMVRILALIVTLLPLLLTATVLRALVNLGNLKLALRRFGIGLLLFLLGSPLLVTLGGGIVWLLIRLLGSGAILVAALPLGGVLVGLTVHGWRRKDAHLEAVTGFAGAYLGVVAALLLLVAQGAALPALWQALVVVTLPLLVAALALFGQGLIAEGRRVSGWATTALGLLLFPLILALALAPSPLESELTHTLGNPALYAGPLGWMTGCAAEMPTMEEIEEATEEPVEDELEDPEAEEGVIQPTLEPTTAPQPTPTAALPGPSETFPLRQIFPETLYWDPEALTGADGTLSVEIPLADNITTWRLTALASTRDGELGAATYALPVFQDFFFNLTIPKPVIQGEVLTVTATLYNYTSETQDIRLHLDQASWYRLTVSPQQVTLPAGDVTSVTFALVPRAAGRFELRVTAEGSEIFDAISQSIDVQP